MTGQRPDGLRPEDDLRHRVPAGVSTRDSLFWNAVIPAEGITVQVYTWADGRGIAGRQVAVYGAAIPPVVSSAHGVDVGEEADFDDWRCAGLQVRQPEPLRSAVVGFAGDGIELEYRFEGGHRPFSYGENPGGCPRWMATARFEQAGTASGRLQLGDRVIPFDGIWAHRDHSSGRRHWSWVHHWKWLVAGTDACQLNAMLHIARGELGVNGYVTRHGEPVALADGSARATYDEDMAQRAVDVELRDATGLPRAFRWSASRSSSSPSAPTGCSSRPPAPRPSTGGPGPDSSRRSGHGTTSPSSSAGN